MQDSFLEEYIRLPTREDMGLDKLFHLLGMLFQTFKSGTNSLSTSRRQLKYFYFTFY